MPEPNLKIDVAKWVENAKADPVAYQQRQTVEIVLNAIAMTAPLKLQMFLKGGILMGLAYDSPRQTTDIDMSTSFMVGNEIGDRIKTLLDSAFPRAAAALGYADLVLKTHSVKKMPKKTIFEKAYFPALKLKIAYAKRGTRQEKALREGKSPRVIDLDISFNESLQQIQVLELTGGQELQALMASSILSPKNIALCFNKCHASVTGDKMSTISIC